MHLKGLPGTGYARKALKPLLLSPNPERSALATKLHAQPLSGSIGGWREPHVCEQASLDAASGSAEERAARYCK